MNAQIFLGLQLRVTDGQRMKTKWLLSVTICLATFQLGSTSPLAAREKDLLPKDSSVTEQLSKEEFKIEQLLQEDSKPEEVDYYFLLCNYKG